MKASIAVTTTDSQLYDQAQNMAKSLKLDFIESSNLALPEKNYQYLLIIDPEHISLTKPADKTFHPFYIDFLKGSLNYRIEHAGLRKEALARAMGCHPREKPVIIDATAGLGRDSYVLASLGFEVVMLERSAILHALVKDAMQRAEKLPSTACIVERMQLFHTDAIAWLENQAYTRRPDVIYMDPMFPERKKSASVKKEMVILHDLLGNDIDREKLLATALKHAQKRVVIKLPKSAAKIGERAVNYAITGRSCRFDVYLV